MISSVARFIREAVLTTTQAIRYTTLLVLGYALLPQRATLQGLFPEARGVMGLPESLAGEPNGKICEASRLVVKYVVDPAVRLSIYLLVWSAERVRNTWRFCGGYGLNAGINDFNLLVQARNIIQGMSEDYFANRSIKDSIFRGTFAETPMPRARDAKNHTHGAAAGMRTAASEFCNQFAEKFAFNIYSYQLSAQDIRQGRRGVRTAYWGKDLGISPRADVLQDSDLDTMIDVDYHIEDLSALLAENFRPHIMYTCLPTSAGGSWNDSSFFFEEDGTMQTDVCGGGRYRHKIWDWNSDCISVRSDLLGFMRYYAVYKVEKQHVDCHKGLVLLTPVGRWYGPFAWLASLLYEAQQLRRFNPVQNGFVRIDTVETVKKLTVRKVSLGIVGHPFSVKVDAAELAQAVIQRDNCDPKYYNVASVATWFKSGDQRDAGRSAANVVKAYLAANARPQQVMVAKYMPEVKHYNSDLSQTEHCKDVVFPIFPSLDENIYAPVNSISNSKWAIEERVTKLQAKAPEGALDPKIREHCKAFVKYVTTIHPSFRGVERNRIVAHLEPRSTEDVLAAFRKPSQVAVSARTVHCALRGTPGFVNSFMKAESYSKISDPRVISPLNAEDKIRAAPLPMALTEYIKSNFKWYAFRTPSEISSHIAESGLDAYYAFMNDVKRMDGSTNRVIRDHVLWPIYRILFCEYPELVEQYIGIVTHRRGLMDFEVAYLTGESVLSGEPGTSINNTLMNAAISWVAMAIATDGDYALCRKFLEASSFGGDDSLNMMTIKGILPQRMTTCFEQASKHLGYSLDIVLRKHGEPVQFLARWFNPWDGDTSSMCDVARQVPKLTVTAQRCATLSDEAKRLKMIQKARSFLLTDANTPIVGPFCKYILTKFSADDHNARETVRDEERWWSQFDDSETFHNKPQMWYMDVVAATYGDFDIARFYADLETDNLRGPYIHTALPAPPKKPVVINGDIVSGEGDSQVVKNVEEQPTAPNVNPIARNDRRDRPDGQVRRTRNPTRARQGSGDNNARTDDKVGKRARCARSGEANKGVSSRKSATAKPGSKPSVTLAVRK